jgi:hypothetical protein
MAILPEGHMLNLLIGLVSVMDQLDLAKYYTHGCRAHTRAARTENSGQENGERIFRSAERRSDLQVSRTTRRRADLGAWQCRNVTEILSFSLWFGSID